MRLGAPGGGAFFGRETELGSIRSALARAADGDGQTAVVVAAGGMGKTAFLQQVAVSTSQVGATILRASGDDDERDLTLGVLDQLFAAGGHTPPVERAPFVAGAELVAVWAELAAVAPLVVIIDDAQWADEPSLHALSFALRRLGSSRVLAIIACNEDGAGRLPTGLLRLADSGSGVRLPLVGLDDEAFESLVGAFAPAPLTAAQVQRLRAHTEGNPMHALSLLRDLSADEIAGDVTRPLRAPKSATATVLARIASLSPEAQALVVAASVLGMTCTLTDAARLAGLEGASTALAEAQGADLLERAASGGPQIRFTHSMTRSAVYYDIGVERSAALHRAASALVSDDREALRHRLRGALETDEALAAEVDATAEALAQSGAWEEGAAWLEAAEHLSSTARSRQRRSLTAAMYRWYAGSRVPIGADTAIDLRNDHPLRLTLSGMVAAAESRYGDAEVVLRAAWELIDPSTDFEMASRVALRLSDTMQGQLRSEESLAWARRSVDVLPVGHTLLGEDPLTDLVFALLTNGQPAEAAAIVAERVPSVFDGVRAAPGLLARGVLRHFEEDLINAVDDISDAADRYLRVGPPHKYIEAQVLLIDANYRMGLWDFAERHAEEALAAARERDIPQLTALVLAMSIGVAAARGEWERAAAAHAEALEQLALRGSYQALGMTWLGGARIALARGDYQGVCEALGTIASVSDAVAQADNQTLMPWRVPYGIALVRLGRVEEAAEHAERLIKASGDGGPPSISAGAARLRGLIAGRRGDAAAAACELSDAAAAFAVIPMPFETAQTELDLGTELRRAGRRREAVAHLESARATFGSLDAAPFIARCEAEIASCGLRRRRRAVGVDVKELTPAEQTVAQLVAEGRSNREVAAELVLSIRTIEHHLRRVYAKLGVSSRSQLARQFRQ